MARTGGRIAAGAAVIAAAVAIGGPGIAAAPADPGSSHGQHDRDRHGQRGDRHGQGGDLPRSGPRNGQNQGRGSDEGSDSDSDKGSDSGFDTGAKLSSGGSEWVDDEPSTGGESGGSTARRPRVAEVRGAQGPRPTPFQGSPAEVPVVPTATGGGGGASPVAGGAPEAIVSPRVVIGNLRSPGLRSDQPRGPITSQVVVAPPVALLPAPAGPQPAPPPDVATWPQVPGFVAKIWMPVGPGAQSSVLFGIAGLVLLPMAGVWLGYRQASAARSPRAHVAS